jgi:glutathione S-transferase
MRARLAVQISRQDCEIREVVLRDKPPSLLASSAKGTVPVLLLSLDHVVDESLDVMLWALGKNDPESWLSPPTESLDKMLTLVSRTEREFKSHLDRYKYANRYEGVVATEHRSSASVFLMELEGRLSASPWLFGSRLSLADAAIAPFVRQFANTARKWFDEQPWPALRSWLDDFLASPLFGAIMDKLPQWHDGDEPRVFPSSPQTQWRRSAS